MKEEKLYVCEICETRYGNRLVAERCEAGHKKIKKISTCRYIPYESDHSGVPHTIVVEMEDGTTVKYKR